MPSLPKRVAYRREHTGDVSRDRSQALAQKVSVAHEQTKAVVQGLPFVNGWALVVGVAFGAGVAQDVTHGLNSTSVKYIEVRRYGANVANAIGDTGTPGDPLNQTRLITTLACTRDILFFIL